jgi:hypothetical protein
MTKRIKSYVVLCCAFWGVLACSPVATKSTSSTTYHEDLSTLRPVYTLPPDTLPAAHQPAQAKPRVIDSQRINNELHARLDTIAAYNRLNRYIDLYTIQVYSGNSRSDATLANGKVLTAIPEIASELVYAQPYFKVRAGRYFTRLEAQRDLALIKKSFPNAILVMEKFPVNP